MTQTMRSKDHRQSGYIQRGLVDSFSEVARPHWASIWRLQDKSVWVGPAGAWLFREHFDREAGNVKCACYRQRLSFAIDDSSLDLVSSTVKNSSQEVDAFYFQTAQLQDAEAQRCQIDGWCVLRNWAGESLRPRPRQSVWRSSAPRVAGHSGMASL